MEFVIVAALLSALIWAAVPRRQASSGAFEKARSTSRFVSHANQNSRGKA